MSLDTKGVLSKGDQRSGLLRYMPELTQEVSCRSGAQAESLYDLTFQADQNLRSAFDLQVACVVDLRRTIRDIEKQRPPLVKAQRQLTAVYDRALQTVKHFHPVVYERTREADRLRGETLKRVRTKSFIGKAVKSSAKDRRRYEELQKDRSVRLLRILRIRIDDLCNKYKQVREFEENPKKLETALGKLVHDVGFVRSWATSAFSVVLVVNRRHMTTDMQKNTDAYYLNNSVFCIVKKARYDQSLSVEHEQVHNLLDGLLELGHFSYKSAAKVRRDLDKLSSQEIFKRSVKTLRGPWHAKTAKLKEHYSNLKVEKVIDWQHEEILADFSEAARGVGFYADRFLPIPEEDLLRAECERKFRVEPDCVWSTAAEQIHKHSKFFSQARELWFRQQDDLGKNIERLSEEIVPRFNAAVVNLCEAHTLGRWLGSDALERVEALALILPPSKWHLLKEYLREHEASKVAAFEQAYIALHSFPKRVEAYATLIELRKQEKLNYTDDVLFIERLNSYIALVNQGDEHGREFREQCGLLFGWRSAADFVDFMKYIREFDESLAFKASLSCHTWSFIAAFVDCKLTAFDERAIIDLYEGESDPVVKRFIASKLTEDKETFAAFMRQKLGPQCSKSEVVQQAIWDLVRSAGNEAQFFE